MRTTRKYTIEIDFAKETKVALPQFIQGDTNVLEFTVIENGVVSSLADLGRVVVNFKRPDKRVISRLLVPVGDALTYELGAEEMETQGLAELELQFYSADNTQRVSTTSIRVQLIPNIGTDAVTEAGESLTLLQSLFIEVDEVNEQLADMVRSVNGVTPDANGNVSVSTGEGGTLPSNLILFEDWLGGESVTIDTGIEEPPADTTDPVLTITSGGTFTGTKTVTLTTNETATIYYTLDGSAPTTASSVYTSALSISATTTLKAFAVDSAGNSSAIQTVTYTLEEVDTTAPTVTASPAAGTYTSAQDVTLSADETATIYYTLDGTTPTTSSSIYSAPINVDVTTTIQFMAVDSAGNQSTPVSATYTTIDIPQDTTAPVLTITPAATFTDSIMVTMSTDDPESTIWYTLDDTDPITSATRIEYAAPITLTETDAIKAYAVDTAGNTSTVQAVTYTKEIASTSDYVNDASLLLYQDNPANNTQIANPDNYFQGSGDFTTGITAKFTIPSGGSNAATLVLSRMNTNVMKLEFNWQHKLTANIYGTSGGSASYPVLTPPNVFDDFSKYYHIVLIRNGTNLRLFVDNVQTAELTTVPSDFTFNISTSPLIIGQDGKAGTFKNITYYNRSLTTEELTQNYNALK